MGPSGIALLLVVGVLATGTLGYMVIEGWQPWDAFFMTVTSITTVGYREVHPLSRSGQVFTVLLLLGGVGTVLYGLTLGVTAVVQGGFASRWEALSRARMIDELRDHFIVCGYGRMGRIIVDEFRRQGRRTSSSIAIPIWSTSWSPPAVSPSRPTPAPRRCCSASALRGRRRSWPRSAPTPRTSTSSSRRGSRAPTSTSSAAPTNDDAVRKLKRAGADRVFSPYQVGAHQIVQAALRPAVVDFVQLATGERLELGIEQVLLSAASPLCGRTLANANVRQHLRRGRGGDSAAGRTDGVQPEPEATMAEGDCLVVMGRPDSLQRLEAVGARRGRSAVGVRPARHAHPRRQRRRPTNSSTSWGRGSRRFAAASVGRPASASFSSATIRLRRSTSGTR